MSEYIINEVPLGEAVFLYDGHVASTRYEIREEIVRCRDCKFSHEVEWPEWPEWMNVPSDYLDCCGELVETWDYYNDEPNYNPVKPDGFCAWGARKEDA